MSDELVFASEQEERDATRRPWNVLICDDEPEIHSVTKLALRGFHLNDRPIRFLHAHSGAEAVERARATPDLALILMDVVMETDTAGLDAIDRIRGELGLHKTRIVLRTGQPGQAPEHEVVTRYDINDYKEKTELTSKKLFTLVYTSLSQYDELVRRDVRQRWLEQVIDSANTIFRRRSPDRLGSGIMRRVLGMMGLPPPDGDADGHGGIAMVTGDDSGPRILHAMGCHAEYEGRAFSDLPDPIRTLVEAPPPDDRRWRREGDHLLIWLASGDTTMTVMVLTAPGSEVADTHMLDLFLESAAIALGNATLNQQMEHAQRELVLMLSEAIERRSREAGNHVRRVGEYCRLLGRLAGLSADEANMLGIAAPLHDAGKIAIPDAILNKPGRHTDEESEIMRTHATVGGQIFEANELPVLKAAAVVAHQHHERWDGLGYPMGLAGEDIHLYGRISALADVFDALFSERCYKPAWDVEDVLDVIRSESGKHFDPTLTALFLEHVDEFLAIRDAYPDQ